MLLIDTLSLLDQLWQTISNLKDTSGPQSVTRTSLIFRLVFFWQNIYQDIYVLLPGTPARVHCDLWIRQQEQWWRQEDEQIGRSAGGRGRWGIKRRN